MFKSVFCVFLCYCMRCAYIIWLQHWTVGILCSIEALDACDFIYIKQLNLIIGIAFW